MKAFMDKEFMLQSPTARHLYHAYAEDMPICDYHCHIPPREIYENRRFDNIAQVWLGGRNPDGSYFGDHYKWRVMRSNGVPEEYITGDKPDRERFQKFAEALPMAIGNPMYHWTNLELHTFFGYDGVLNGDTAEEVWNLCNDKLQHDPKLTVRGLIEQSNVAFIGTTDDPIDSLECGQCQTVIFRITGIGTRRNHYRRSSTSQHTCHVGVTKQRHRFIECISRLDIGKDQQIRMSHHRRADSFHLTAMRITCRLHIHGSVQVHVSVSTGGGTFL